MKKLTMQRHKKNKKTMAKRARWMRNGSATVHEGVVDFILKDIAKGQPFKLKNQKIFYDEINDKWYIADFYIPELNMVIEIDGPNHSKSHQLKYDNIRTNFLNRIGVKVVRIENEDVESLDLRDRLISIIQGGLLEKSKKPKPVKMYDSGNYWRKKKAMLKRLKAGKKS